MKFGDVFQGMQFILQNQFGRILKYDFYTYGDYQVEPGIQPDLGFFLLGCAPEHQEEFDRIDEYSSLFSSATPGNALKLNSLVHVGRTTIDPHIYDFSGADQKVDSLLAAGMRVRGHTLVWDKFGHTRPAILDRQVKQTVSSDLFIRKTVETQIHQVMGHFAGRVEWWDVVNEPLAYGAHGEVFDGRYGGLPCLN